MTRRSVPRPCRFHPLAAALGADRFTREIRSVARENALAESSDHPRLVGREEA
jgi:hypothetical protein